MELDPQIIVADLTGEASPDEQVAIARWLRARADHQEQYDRMRRLWNLLGEVEWSDAHIGGSVLSAATVATARPVRAPASTRHLRVPQLARGLLAAGIVAVAIGAAWFGRAMVHPAHLTSVETGEHQLRTVQLADGTVIRLGPLSRISFDEAGASREVRLDGQAYFAVAHQEGIPFRVSARGGQVRVLGTRFDVLARGSELNVTVVDGAVELAAQGRRVAIGAHQMGRSDVGSPPVVESATDVYEMIGWVGDFTAYDSTPLSEVAREFERRFGLPIEIADPELTDRTVTGWFSEQPPLEMIETICGAVNARCTSSDGMVRMQL